MPKPTRDIPKEPEQQCAQCKKEYRHSASSIGCPKCAPGLSVLESEFRKPIEQPAQDDWKDRLIAQNEETILWQAKRIADLTAQRRRVKALIDEAAIQMVEHPSKDARFFAKSVYEYLTSESEQQKPVVWLELLREARDNCKASIVEDGISASRKEYRIDLEARLTAALNTLPQAREPVAYIRKDQLQKAVQSPMLCEVTPEPRQDRVGIYTRPQREPLTEPDENNRVTIDRACFDRGCACFDPRIDKDAVIVEKRS